MFQQDDVFLFVCFVFTSWDICDQRRCKDDQTVMATKEGVKNQSGANKRVLGLISAFRTKENSASCTTASIFTNQFHSFIFSSENLDSPNLTCLTWGECRDPAWFWVWPLSATFDWLSLKRVQRKKYTDGGRRDGGILLETRRIELDLTHLEKCT